MATKPACDQSAWTLYDGGGVLHGVAWRSLTLLNNDGYVWIKTTHIIDKNIVGVDHFNIHDWI